MNTQSNNYIAIQHRWRNSIRNIETDPKANIKSDHYPVTAKVQIKFKAAPKTRGPGRKQYKTCTNHNWNEYTGTMINRFMEFTNNEDDIKTNTENYIRILQQSTNDLDTLPRKEKT